MKKYFIFLIAFQLLTVSLFALGQINIAYSPFTINNPGAYILTKDLHTNSNLTAISILTSNIFLDLNGHTIYGAGTTTGIAGIGIAGDTIKNYITIVNGSITNFRDTGIILYGSNISLSRIKSYRNRNIGIIIGSNSRVEKSFTYGNGSTGIFAFYGTSLVENNSSNNYIGVSVSTGCRVTGNLISQNPYGVRIPGGGNVLERNLFSNNTAALILESTSSKNYYGNNNMFANTTTIVNNGTGNHDATTIDPALTNLNM